MGFAVAVRDLAGSTAPGDPLHYNPALKDFISDSFFFTADPSMFNLAAYSRSAALQQSGELPSKRARDWLRDFRDRPQVLTHIEAKWNFKKRVTWSSWHRTWAHSFARNSFNVVARRKLLKELTVRRLLEFNRRALLANRQRHFLAFVQRARIKRDEVYVLSHAQGNRFAAELPSRILVRSARHNSAACERDAARIPAVGAGTSA